MISDPSLNLRDGDVGVPIEGHVFGNNNEGETQEVDSGSLVHKVSIAPPQSVGKQLTSALKEIFFPDDPFRQFRGQTPKQKWILGAQYVFPILEWLPKYKFSLLRGDIIAGLTIASLAIPQDIGYAKLANLSPVHGLYSSFVPPLVYAAMGSSRDIAIGPVAVVSILLGTLLKDQVNPSDPNYLRLAFTATFFAGVVQLTLGFLRLGFIIDFLSHAAIVGFMAGAAITIGLQQLKGFLGITNFTTKTDIVSVMRSVFLLTDQWNWQTIVIGIVCLFFLLLTRIIAKKKKDLFWVAALAPLTVVLLSTIVVYATRADKHGVKIVGHIVKGVNPPSAREIFWTGKYLGKGFLIGIVAGLVGLTEAVAIARTFAALKDYKIDGNKEMISIGVMNMVGSVTSCYVSTGSFSRSAVNFQSGCNTALANVVMSSVVLFTLLFITPIFRYTPNSSISAIIMNALVSLIEIPAAILIWKIDKSDFLVMLGAFFGVVFISVEYGLLIAVGISFAKIVFHVTRPHTAVLGKIPGLTVYGNTRQYPNATPEPGILIVRVDASIYFANSNYIRERVLRYVDDYLEKQLKDNDPSNVPLQFLVVELTPVMSIDTTAIHAFEDLHNMLRKRDIQLALANPGGRVLEKFDASGFVSDLGDQWFFLSVSQAVEVLLIIIKRNDHDQSEKRLDNIL